MHRLDYSIATAPHNPGSATIALDRGATVTGRVVNGAGHGIRNAEMHITGSGVDDISSSSFVISDPFDGPEPSPFLDNLTDPSGRYAIHSVRAGQAEVCARNAKGYENGCLSSQLGLSSGSTATAPDLTLPAQVRTAATTPARPLARRPDWNELVIGARVIERRPASAGPVPFVGPFGSPFAPQFASRLASPAASPFGGAYSDPFAAALTTRLVLAGEKRAAGS